MAGSNEMELSESFASNAYDLNDGKPQEYIWSCMLDKENPEWKFDTSQFNLEDATHSLFLSTGVLGVGAKSSERNIVQADTKGYAQKDTTLLVASLSLGVQDMCNLDISFCHSVPVTFKLIEGNGPVHLAGVHLIEVVGDEAEEDADYKITEADEDEDEGEEDEGEDEDEEEEEEESEPEPEVVKPKKRKVHVNAKSSKSKRGKMERESSSEESSEAEESEESEDESPKKKKSSAKKRAAKKIKSKVKSKAKKPAKKLKSKSK